MLNELVDQLTAERQAPRRRRIRRMWSLDRLPMAQAFFHGPKWKRLCGVEEKRIADIDPAAAKLHRPGRKLLMFSLEDEVRELATRRGLKVYEELRPGVFEEWSDGL